MTKKNQKSIKIYHESSKQTTNQTFPLKNQSKHINMDPILPNQKEKIPPQNNPECELNQIPPKNQTYNQNPEATHENKQEKMEAYRVS